jgi:hypothetical protein
MSLEATDGSSADVFDLMRERAGWTIVVDEDVDELEVSGSWDDRAWYQILADILDDAGLCWSTTSLDHSIKISNCQ